MELTLTREFGREDEDLHKNHTDMADYKMREAVHETFYGAELGTIVSSLQSMDEESMTVEATVEWTDAGYLFRETDMWRDFVHQEASEDIYIGLLKPRSEGVTIKGAVTVRMDSDQRAGADRAEEAMMEEAIEVAARKMKRSFGSLSRLDFGRVVGSSDGTYYEVRYSGLIPYRASVLGSQTQRRMFGQMSVPGDWQQAAKTY